MSRREVGPVIVSFSLVCRLFPDLSFPDSRLSYFFFFKGSGAPRDLPSSPPRPSPDLADPLRAVPPRPAPGGPGTQPPPRHLPLEGLRQSEAHAGGPRHHRRSRSGLAGAAGKPLGLDPRGSRRDRFSTIPAGRPVRRWPRPPATLGGVPADSERGREDCRRPDAPAGHVPRLPRLRDGPRHRPPCFAPRSHTAPSSPGRHRPPLPRPPPRSPPPPPRCSSSRR